MQRNILMSTLPLAISIILIIVVAKVGLGKVSSLRNEILQGEKDRATLTEKLNTLNSLGGDLQTRAVLSTYILPDKNPSLLVLSQMKILATQNLVGLSKVKTGGGASQVKGLSNASLTFDIVGPTDAVLAFIKGIGTVAPIVHIDKVKLSEQVDQMTGSITLSSYYAPYPNKIPSLTTPIKGLTPDEIATLNVVANLIPPQFASLSPSTSTGKSDPFSQ